MAHRIKPVEDVIRQRAYQIWEEQGRPIGRHTEHWRRAREEIQRQFERDTAHAGDDPDRLRMPQPLEEAIEDPGHSLEPGGEEWTTTPDRRGAP